MARLTLHGLAWLVMTSVALLGSTGAVGAGESAREGKIAAGEYTATLLVVKE